MIPSPLKWHGGKHYLAAKIVGLMPPHVHYVEPFAGSLAVLLAKDPEGVSEVANDLDGRLTNFWRCLACVNSFAQLRRRVEATPFCEAIWGEAREHLERTCHAPDTICLGCAWAFFIACRQSLAGRMESFAPLSRRRVRRGMNEQTAAWLSAVDGLPLVHDRLRRVAIRCQPAVEVIRKEDGPDTLFYCDPPYLHSTRATTHEYGPYEMTSDAHADLLHTLATIEGKFLLSGYANAMYDMVAEGRGWRRVDFDLPNNAASGGEKRRMVESVWCNF